MLLNRCLLLLILALCQVFCEDVKSENGTFFYFGYGSNLLKKRIQINNPSAKFYSTALLQNYRLDFKKMAENQWNGAVATIVQDNTRHVWCDVWTLDLDQLENLDKQEGVDLGWYFAKDVAVTTPDNRTIVARTYELVHNPPNIDPEQDLPLERRPSSTYLQVIALGAIESGLPAEYISYIFSIPTNRKMATKECRDTLGYPY